MFLRVFSSVVFFCFRILVRLGFDFEVLIFIMVLIFFKGLFVFDFVDVGYYGCLFVCFLNLGYMYSSKFFICRVNYSYVIVYIILIVRWESFENIDRICFLGNNFNKLDW